MPGCLIILAIILLTILVSPWFAVGLIGWALLVAWADS